MGTIKLKKIEKDEAVINFHVNLDARGSSGYETDITLRNTGRHGFSEWTCEMSFTNMPPQCSPEEAVDRMGLYLRNMAKAMKGKNIKHLNVDTLFDAVHK
ncbi:hypothetical protein VPH234P10_0016 [Vibrio phage 234P10]|nr:hypothetical protein SIPHO062v1_p0023 [Vibrio phage PS17B.1]